MPELPEAEVVRRGIARSAAGAAAGPLEVLDARQEARYDDGCLSIPGRPVEVTRPAAIGIGWYDLDGRYQVRDMQGPAARIAQHEVDHLDGLLIVKD